MRTVVPVMIVLLLILRQDFWNWDDGTLIFGFMPIGLFYQACISLGAAFTWFLAVTFCWPAELERSAPKSQNGGRS